MQSFLCYQTLLLSLKSYLERVLKYQNSKPTKNLQSFEAFFQYSSPLKACPSLKNPRKPFKVLIFFAGFSVMEKDLRDGVSSRSLSLGSPSSLSPLYEQLEPPQTSSCFDQTLMLSEFSRLSVSSSSYNNNNRRRSSSSNSNNQALYVGSGYDLANGVGGVDHFLPCSFQPERENQRVGEFGHLGVANTNFLEIFVPERNQLRQREYPNRLSWNGNGLVSDISMNSCGWVDGLGSKKSRFPNWLKDSMNCWSLKDLRGMMLYMAQNQQWSRYLQCKMDGCTDEEKIWIFTELIEHVGKLMLHPFGNYVAQKLVEICGEHQRTQILQKVIETNSLVHMCLNNLGSRSIQKLLKHFTTQQQISMFMYALSPGTLALSKDLNGQHVIQHCLMHFSDEDNMHLLNEVANNCLKIATDRSGCCVLQKCLKHSKGALKERLVAGIIANALLLAEDQYGNYVVQYLLELRIPQVTEDLLRQFKGSYFIFSSNKFGSNVVEKCLVETVEEHSASIIIELLTDPKCSMLLIDPYGNFVIQKALLVSKGYIRNALLELVQSNSSMMTSNLYGRKVLTFCQKELNINFRTRC